MSHYPHVHRPLHLHMHLRVMQISKPVSLCSLEYIYMQEIKLMKLVLITKTINRITRPVV